MEGRRRSFAHAVISGEKDKVNKSWMAQYMHNLYYVKLCFRLDQISLQFKSSAAIQGIGRTRFPPRPKRLIVIVACSGTGRGGTSW